MSGTKYARYIHLQAFERVPVPWNEIFGNENPITVEVGFGSGEYLCDLAMRHPDENFVGFETSLTSVEKALTRFERLKLTNVRVARVDGRFALRELFEDNSVDRVIVNFPCPWPKKKHSKRRLTREDFAETLAAVLKLGGTFELTTDVGWFAGEMAEALENVGAFSNSKIVVNPDRPVKTRYERKWISQGRTIYSLEVRKTKHKSVERTVTGELPHVRLEKIDTGKLTRLKGQIWRENGKVVVIKDVYRGLDGENWLVLAYSSDGDFQQHYYILITKKGDGFLVKLDSTTVPFRTPAVKWSVNQVARMINL